ncbi:hypothetical protein Tco_0042712, partial [Tanacetum coccineum]
TSSNCNKSTINLLIIYKKGLVSSHMPRASTVKNPLILSTQSNLLSMYDPLYLEIWSITFPIGLQIQHAEDLTTFSPFPSAALRAAVLTGLAVLIDAALGELCLAALTGTCPDFVATAVGTKFLLACG